MLRITEEVWSVWHERSAEIGADFTMRMFFVPAAGDVDVALKALRSSLSALSREYDERRFPEVVEPPFFGEWDCVRSGVGVVVSATECQLFDEALTGLAAGLESRGIAGTLSVYRPQPIAHPPPYAPMLACRVSVRGERVRKAARSYRWTPDPVPYREMLAVAAAWCRWDGAAEACSLWASIGGPIAIEPEEPVLERMLDEIAMGGPPRIKALRGEEFRAIGAWSGSGRVALVAGRRDDVADWWRAPLADLRGVLRDRADLLVYGFIARGWAVNEAIMPEALSYDWPVRPSYYPKTRGFSGAAFDDLVAPDAFGVQLLGPGYADRLATPRDWHEEILGEERVLLEHEQPDAWFDAPFVPIAQSGQTSAPDVLTRARNDLAPLLYTPTALGDFGYPDMVKTSGYPRPG
jgi:hypothetical protein